MNILSAVYIIKSSIVCSIKRYSPSISGKVLDFGCGNKPYSSFFPGATEYIGVDIKQSGHDHSDSKVDIYYDGVTLPFMDEEFDSIVSFEVMEHVFNINAILLELNRVLKKNGNILVSLPFAWEEHEVPFDFARYSSFGSQALLEAAGFEIKALEKTTTTFLAISQLFIAYIYQWVSPKNRIFRLMFLSFFIPFSNIVAILLNKVLKKRYDLYSNIVILATKL